MQGIRRHRVVLTAAIALLLAVCGCGKRTPPAPDLTCHPVKGKVFAADGRPLTAGTVTLAGRSTEYSAKGKIQPDGTFTLTTYFAEPVKEVPGAPVGGYMARVQVDQSSPLVKLKMPSVKIEAKDNQLTLEVLP